MEIIVKLFATLQNGRFKNKKIECDEGTHVSQVIENLGIKKNEFFITFVNGRHAEPDQVLNNDDILAVFPPVGGG